jgi:hypothetical protein
MRPIQIQNVIRILAAVLFAGFPAVLAAQSNSDGSMPQYLFPGFSKSEVSMKNGQIQTPMMNYNTVTETMVFVRDGKYYDMTNLEMVDSVFLNDCKFVPSGKIFYEVLLSGKIDLFIQHKGDLLPPGKPVGYGGTSQVASSSYISGVERETGYYNLPLPADYIVKASPVYWVRIDYEMVGFINEKQFLKLFPDKTDEIKEFIRKNRLKIDRPADLTQIVRYCSELK